MAINFIQSPQDKKQFASPFPVGTTASASPFFSGERGPEHAQDITPGVVIVNCGARLVLYKIAG